MTSASWISQDAVRMGMNFTQGAPDRAKALMRAEDLNVEFGSFQALRGVSLELGSTGVHAVIGPNGAGKTTLFNALSGFAKTTRGRLHFDGKEVTGSSPDQLSRRGLARSFQICSIFPNLSVADNLAMSLARDAGIWGWLRRRDGREELAQHAQSLLAETGLSADRHRRASDLSYGQKRLLEIITTMALRPKLLLLDEPMAGLAREDIPPVAALVAGAARTCSVLMVEHNLEVVEKLAARVTVMAEGAVLCEGPYAQVAQDPRVVEAYIGADHHA